MEASRTTVSISIELALEPIAVFDVFIEELTVALIQSGMSFVTGRTDASSRESLRWVASLPGSRVN